MTHTRKINVLLVDDHTVVRDGLRAILEVSGEIQCQQAESAEEALAMLNNGLTVHVVLLDISLPGMGGLEALGEMHKLRPGLPILLLSMHPEEQFAVRALRMGAIGYLSKSTPSAEVWLAVKAAARGENYLSRHAASMVAQSIQGKDVRPAHESLSNREFEILCLIGSGKSVSEIAQISSLSVKTISTYRERILTKMNLQNNFDMIRYVLQEGLLQ